MTIRTNSLEPGAYTNWWVFFNDPSACVAIPCGLGDLDTPAVMASILFATGNVVGPPGTSAFAASASEGDTVGALFGPGLLNSRTAEVHLIVRSHGEVLPMFMPAQINSVGGGCLVNVCDDVQAAIHLP